MFRRLLDIRMFVQLMILCAALLTPQTGGAAAPVSPAPEAKPADAATRQRAIQMLQSGPAVFVENRGQWADAPVRFVLSGMGVNVGLTSQAMRFQVIRREAAPGGESQKTASPMPARPGEKARNEKVSHTEFQTVFEGARAVAPEGRTKSGQVFHYRIGEASRWRENVPAWEGVVYPGLYEGIDLVLTGSKGGLKYEFHVSPGADWRRIRLHYEGIAGLSLEADGSLAIRPAEGWAPLTDGAPVIFQEEGGARKPVAGRFQKLNETTIGFEITGSYDPAKPLVIDPDLSWSQYHGSTGTEDCTAVAVDDSGYIFIAGSTDIDGWISGGGQSSLIGGRDGFIVRLTSSGAASWSTYVGGSGLDYVNCIAADSGGGVYVGGKTESNDFNAIPPVAFDTSLGGSSDGFLMHVRSDGDPDWATYIGSTDGDEVRCLATDGGDIYVGGNTANADWGGQSSKGGTDGFIAAFRGSGGLHWARYIGGAQTDSVEGIAVDGSGSVYATGYTKSPGWVSGGYDLALAPVENDAFAVKYNISGGHVWSTYIGGNSLDKGRGIAVDSKGNVIVVGDTESILWTVNGTDLSYGGNGDGFAVKINANGTHRWSTYLGGAGLETAVAVVAGLSDTIYIAGETHAGGWFTGGWDTTHAAMADTYLLKLDSAGTLLWGGMIGGIGYEEARGLAKGLDGAFFVAGKTDQAGWTTRSTFRGAWDAFLAKVVDYGALRVTIEPPEARAQGAKWRLNGGAWNNSGVTLSNIPGGVHTVEFSDDTTDWQAPAAQPVNVINADITSVTFTYTRKTGSLSINIKPAEVVLAGAQWRPMITGIGWQNSGAIVTDLPTGPITVEFQGVTPWVTPANMDVNVIHNQITQYDANYIAPGYLRVDITPPEAAAAGAQWQVVGFSFDWINSGAIEPDMPPGNYTVQFKDIVGWTTPANTSVTINEKQQTLATGNYVRQYGSVRVNLSPGAAVAAGAKWKVQGFGNWMDSGATLINVPAGPQIIEFNTIADWNPPANVPVDVLNNQTATVNAAFVRQTGSVRVTITPAGAPAGGAQWRLLGAGSGSWRNSGAVETGIPTGTYSVEFKDIPQWDKPAITPVTVTYNATADVTGDYVYHFGSLSVTIEPDDVLPLGAQWRRKDTTTWYDSGQTEANVPTGTYYLQFKPLTGWAASSSIQVTVLRGQVAQATGTYYNVGSLRVDISPPEAVAAGAKWRRVGSETWLNSGYTEPDVPATENEIEFSTVAGWNDPDDVTVTVNIGQMATATGTYTRQYGGLQVELYPAAAVAAGAKWRRSGTTGWLDSGAVESNIPVGAYALEFTTLTLWSVPPPMQAAVAYNSVTQTSATYAPVQGALVWSTYLGDNQFDMAYDVTTDASGAIFIAGYTNSAGWLNGGPDNTPNGDDDIFLIKLNPAGTPAWGTYLGGSLSDYATGIVLDRSGDIILCGQTDSNTGWISGGGDTTYNGGNYDGFVMKLNSSGVPAWGTYLGGNGSEIAWKVAVDSLNNIIVCGSTDSKDNWATGGWQGTFRGGSQDGYVCKLTPGGTRSWGSYLGGNGHDDASGVAVDKADNIFIAGWTASSAAWVSNGPQTTPLGNGDIFLVKLNGAGAHQWSTYKGGSSGELANAIVIDGADNILLTGSTSSDGWFGGQGDTTRNGGSDAYVLKLNNAGVTQWGAYLGGAGTDESMDLALDDLGNIYAAGITRSVGWASGGYDTLYSDFDDAFVARLSPTGRHVWSTFVGGDGTDWAFGVAVDPFRRVVAAGLTSVYDESWATGGYDTIYGPGVGDGFAIKLMNMAEIRVDITPAAAAANGAKWRRKGTTAWLDAGTTESALLAGNHTVEFKPLPGWNTPPEINLVASEATLTTALGNYTMRAGALRGTITPNEAVANGAKWHRVGSAQWFNSHDSDPYTPAGTQTVEFSDIPNFTKPANKVVNVTEGQTTDFSGNYLRHLGSVTVSLNPPGAITDGAKWRLVGVSGWTASGATLNNIPTGTYQVEFLQVSGWTLPAPQPVTILQNQTATPSGTYAPGGDLTVTITPATANTAGARWRRQGTTDWLASGTETGVPVGDYNLEFLDLPGWDTPAPVSVSISQGQLATRTANYIRHVGSLTVTIFPADAVTSGAQWRRTGTPTWRNSGTTENGVGTGNVFVEYKDLPGWLTPNPSSAVVTRGQLSQTSGTYMSPGGNLLWSTYVGDVGTDSIEDVALDANDNIYVTGGTNSAAWFPSGYAGDVDVFVMKLTPTGQPVWSTYLGGTLADTGNDLVVNKTDGSIYVTGVTASSGWLTGSFDASFNDGGTDGFLTKLNPTGVTQWGTYLGGDAADTATGIGLDRAGNVYACGETASAGWVAGGWIQTFPGKLDGFLVKFAPDGKRTWSTYLGGAEYDNARKLAIDSAGNVAVTGYSMSTGWVSGGYDTTLNGVDAYVTKITSSGLHLWSTYIGGDLGENGKAVAVDPAGNIILAGQTRSTGWVSGGYDTTWGGNDEGFAAKLSAAGQILWSTYLGGDSYDYAYDVVTDASGGIYVAGNTFSAGWVSGGFKTAYVFSEATLVRLSPGGRHVWSTYLGGNDQDIANGVAVDKTGKIILAGYTMSWGWTSNGYDNIYEGRTDGFIAKLQNVNALSVSITPPAAVTAGGKWRRLGTSTWRNSGTTETLAPGVHTIEFRPVSGYTTPANMQVTVGDIDMATTVGNYVRQTGSLQVIATPAEAAASAAKWRVGTGAWMDSGVTVAGLPTGNYTIQFSTIPLWNTPPNLPVTVVNNQTVIGTGAYVRQNGALQVTIGPPEAVADGAKWRRSGTTPWLDSGYTEPAVPTGNQTVEYMGLAGWAVPPTQDVTVQLNTTATINMLYSRKGDLAVTIKPDEAVAQGAKWRRVGTTLWLDSGTTETGVPIGTHIIEFTNTADWSAPLNRSVDITRDVTTALEVTYPHAVGTLQVFLNPPPAVGSGVQWKRVGTGTWLDSGTSETGVLTGTHDIQFKDVTGWYTPATFSVTVANSQLTQTSATYTPVQAWLHWSTYAGGAAADTINDIAVDGNEEIYVTGSTTSGGWISGGPDNTPNGDVDAFVMKLSHLGSPIWSTYLGGTGADVGYGVALDWSRHVYVAGKTASTGWISGGFDNDYNGGTSDGFVLQLDMNNGATLWGNYLGGSDADIAYGVAVYANGNVNVCGETFSTGWTATGGWLTSHQGGSVDGFVVQLTQAGQQQWSSFVGGAGWENTRGIAVDTSQNVFLTGFTTYGGTWISGGWDSVYGGASDAYVVKLNSAGQFQWSTFVGGDKLDAGYSVATDLQGNAFIAGRTTSAGWTAWGGDTTYNGGDDPFGDDAFLVKLSPAGQHLWSSYIGGASQEIGYDVAVDNLGGAYVAGFTASAGWVKGGIDLTYSYNDGFLAKFADTGRHVWSTYLGGTGVDEALAVGISGERKTVVAGYTYTPDWVQGGFDLTHNGDMDAFIARIQNVSELRVDILPVEAVAEGARWRRVGTTVWLDSGTTESNLWPGNYTIEFNTIPGWGTPANVDVALAPAQFTVVTGNYTAYKGQLRVNIYPQEAIDAGAMWRRGGAPYWFNSGQAEGNVRVGTQQVVFRQIPDWDEPTTLSVTVLKDQMVVTSATYTHQIGSITTTITPPAAVAAGAKWRRVGTTPWLNSGATDKAVPTGNVQVEFLHVNGWAEPAARTVAVVRNQNTAVQGTYQYSDASLKVTILPAEAIAGGAQWRRVGTTTWRNSGDTETGLLVGAQQVEFKTITGWINPAVKPVTLIHAQTTQATATYVRHLGYLRVDIAPIGAVNLGAKWRRKGTSAWLNSSQTEANIPTGNYVVEFLPLANWDKPADQTVTINYNATTVKSASYVPHLGTLQVDIGPAAALTAGAKWRRVGTTTWFGTAETNIPVGTYQVEFLPIKGWTTPATISGVTVMRNMTTRPGATYVRQYGSLRVYINPTQAVEALAQWRRVGTTPWINSGVTDPNLPTDDYQVEFKAIPGWIPPSPITVTVNHNQTAVGSATYSRQTGLLKVTIDPYEAADAGGKWRRVGTSTWYSTGGVEDNVPTGPCQVEFTDIQRRWWLSPGTLSVMVEPGKTAHLVANYGCKMQVTPMSPLSLAMGPGESVTMQVAAYGPPQLTYQWMRNGVKLGGQTSNTLTLSSVKLSDEARYVCVVRNAWAKADSPTFGLVVNKGSGVIQYLLGLNTNTTGLDLNTDSRIDIADAIVGVRQTAPMAPSQPSPSNNATWVTRRPRLDWADCPKAGSYDLYLWTTGSRPATPYASGLKVSHFSIVNALQYATTYKWQVISRRADDTSVIAAGSVWNFTVEKAIRLLTPNGGETLTRGGSATINWKTDTVAAGTEVRIELWRGTARAALLKDKSFAANGIGSLSVMIPSTSAVPPGTNYRIRVISAKLEAEGAGAKAWDECDAYIKIK